MVVVKTEEIQVKVTPKLYYASYLGVEGICIVIRTIIELELPMPRSVGVGVSVDISITTYSSSFLINGIFHIHWLTDMSQ